MKTTLEIPKQTQQREEQHKQETLKEECNQQSSLENSKYTSHNIWIYTHYNHTIEKYKESNDNA